MAFDISSTPTLLAIETSLSIGTENVYIVPSGKTARVQLMFYFSLQPTGSPQIYVRVNFEKIAEINVVDQDMLTGVPFGSTSRPCIYIDTGLISSGYPSEYVLAPLPNIYYLDSNDRIQYTIVDRSAAAAKMVVFGTEFDK